MVLEEVCRNIREAFIRLIRVRRVKIVTSSLQKKIDPHRYD